MLAIGTCIYRQNDADNPLFVNVSKTHFTNTVFNEDNKIKRLCVNLKARNLMSIIKKYYIASTSRIHACDYRNPLTAFPNMPDTLAVLFEHFNVNLIFVH